MKRSAIRLSLFTTVAVLGCIAIGWAQRGTSTLAKTAASAEQTQQSPSASDPFQAGARTLKGAPVAQSVDPFSGRRSLPRASSAAEEDPADYESSVYRRETAAASEHDTFPSADESLGARRGGEIVQAEYSEDQPAATEDQGAIEADRYSSEPAASDSELAAEPSESAPPAARYRLRTADEAPIESPDDAIAPAAEEQQPSETQAEPADVPSDAVDAASEDAISDVYDRSRKPIPRSAKPAKLGVDPFDRGEPAARAAPAEIHAEQDDAAPIARQGRRRPFDDEAGAGARGTGLPGKQELDGPQSPSVTIQKIAPAEIQIGKPATFEVIVRNDGAVPAQNVQVHDEVPKGTQFISATPPAAQGESGQLVWQLDTLAPKEERKLQVELMPIEEGEIGSVAQVSFSAQASARTVATRPALEIELTAPKEVLIGDPVTLSIKVTNPGTGVATGVVIEENVPEGLEHESGPELEYELGDLEPGATQTLELTLTAAKAGIVQNLLVARGEGDLRAEKSAEMEVLAPALEIELNGPKRRYLEREATYTVSISNPGTAPAQGIELVTYLPKGFDFVKADNFGEYDPDTRAVHWSLEELPAQETGEVTLTALPTEAGEQKLLIEGTADLGLMAKQEQAIIVEGVASIIFQVVDVADPIELGTETTYEIRVENQGSKAASNIRVVGAAAEGMKLLSAEGPTKHSLTEGQVTFEALPELGPKAETTFRVRVQALQPGDQRLAVQLVTDDMSSPVTKEESTQVLPDE